MSHFALSVIGAFVAGIVLGILLESKSRKYFLKEEEEESK